MYTAKTVFAQLMKFIPEYEFQKCFDHYKRDYISKPVSRSTLADANEKRDWRIYADFAQILIKQARPLYIDDNDFRVDMDNMVYAFDSTTIDLCLSLYPWAKFHHQKGAIKMHTLMDLRGSIPVFIDITKGSVHDINSLDVLPVEPGSYYILDKGYIDFHRLYTKIHQSRAFFVHYEEKHP